MQDQKDEEEVGYYGKGLSQKYSKYSFYNMQRE